MKTTLKTVFTELDDELMELDLQDNAPDIDIGKIKSQQRKERKKEIQQKNCRYACGGDHPRRRNGRGFCNR